ncbi:MAG: GNAT family N-acetyltransferase [Clostridiales bacterium]|nr:GNAT family N-acetyltransferase [Clostridiales bacterium]
MVSCVWAAGDEIDTAKRIMEEALPGELERLGEGLFLLAYENNEPVGAGFFAVPAGEEAPMLGPVAVKDGYRGRGLGGLITRMLIRAAYDKGYNKQRVRTAEGTEGFFIKLGFKMTDGRIMERQGDITGDCE